MWGAHEVDGRISAKNAVKIRAALRLSIDAKEVYENYLATSPAVSDNATQDRARARAWAFLNLRLNNEALRAAIYRLYAEAWVTGEAAAEEAIYEEEELAKAGEIGTIDWSKWQPGDKATAMLLSPPRAFQELVERSGSLIRGLDRTGYEVIGTALADSIRAGYSPKRAAKLIQDAVGSPARALTIAVTESSRVMNSAALARYKDAGITSVKWMAVLSVGGGSVACEKCAENDGQIVQLGQSFNTGVSQPPQHPHCRCNLRPVVPDYADMPNEHGVIDIAPKPKPMPTTSADLLDRMTYQRRLDFWSKTVPYDQDMALFSYTSNSYLNMQSVARTGKVGLGSTSPEHLAKIVKANDDLADLISSAPPLPSPLVTYRGIQGDVAKAYLGAKPGDIIKDKGFSSTSLLREKAEIYNDTPLPGSLKVNENKAILEIINPEGARGVMVEGFNNDIIASDPMITDYLATAFSTRTQYEWLLNRNSSFEVISIKGNTVTVRLK